MPPDPALPGDSLASALLHAAGVVRAVMAGSNLDAALAACWQQVQPAAPQRGAIQDLAYATLRQYGRGDFLLSRLLHAPLDAQPGSSKELLHALLLVALQRLATRPQEAHTLVNQTVHAAAQIGHGQYKQLCNAILRNYLRQSEQLLTTLEDAPQAWHQHPQWWLDQLYTHYPQHWPAMVAANNSHPPMTLRVNRRQGSVADYVQALASQGHAARPLDDSALMLEKPLAVDQLPGFSLGQVSVQDWGAQQAARWLDVHDGQRVLDACAAPGGKTGHILELANVQLTALELEPRRSQRIHDNLQRLQLKAQVINADAREPARWWDGQPFERILADVPCSASAVVRRHPDIKWLRRPQDLAGFGRSQTEILEALWQVLAPGGKMLYCTCSVFPQENAAQIDAFLSRHADASCLPLPATELHQAPHKPPTSAPPYRQLLPHPDHDGFFYALLQKHP